MIPILERLPNYSSKLLSLAAVLAFTACGGGDDAASTLESNSSTSPSATTGTAVAKSLIAVTADATPPVEPGVAEPSLALAQAKAHESLASFLPAPLDTSESNPPASTGAQSTAKALKVAVQVNPALGYLRTIHVNVAAKSEGNGSQKAPYQTVDRAMRDLRAGDDVVVAAGTYREWVKVPALAAGVIPTRIRAAVARSVTIKGSREVSGWTLVSPGVYAVAWAEDEPQQVFRSGAPFKQIGGSVFGGYPMTQEGELAGAHAGDGGIWPNRISGGIGELVDDSFTFDAVGRRLVVKVSRPIGSADKLEVSVHPHVLQAETSNNLTVEGIDFAHSNISFYRRWGAVKIMGNANTLRNLVIRDMDGTCVQIIGDKNALLDSTVERCGQTGISGSGRQLTIASNRVLSNNTRGFNKWWEAGGMKLIGYGGLHDSVIRNNVVAYNHGDGIWLDTKNTNVLIENNTTAYNAGFGIHYESSQSGTIRGNRSYGNTMRGIYLFESSSTLVEGNSVFGNAMEGIGVVDGGRSAADLALKPYDNRVLNNTIAWNDFNRNWIQLVLPGDEFRSISNNNSFKSERLPPRMSMAFMSPTNDPYVRLDLWQSVKRLDLASTSETLAMPVDLKAALEARRLLTADQLPRSLAVPGSY